MADTTEKTAEEIAEERRQALLKSLEQMDIKPNALATAGGIDAGTLRGVVNGKRGMGEKSWQKAAAACPPGTPLRDMFADDLPGEAPAEPAAPAAAPKPAGESVLQMIPLNRLKPGPNYRKTFNDDSIAELADSILQHGLRQNLTTYLEDPEDGCFPIDSGERRFRAMSLLVKRGDWPADRPVQCLVQDLAPDMGLALSIIENLQREDVPPAEEAEAFIRLRDSFNWSASDIAEKIGGKGRKGYVLQRMNLLEKLVPEGLKLYVADKITFEQARALWTYPFGVQHWLIKQGFAPRDPAFCRDQIARAFPPMDEAIFDAVSYTGETFTIGKKQYAEDFIEFEKLQREAIDLKLTSLKEKWLQAEITEHTFYDWEFKKTRDRKKGFAVIQLDKPSSYEARRHTRVKIFEGYCEKGSATTKSASASGGAPQPKGLTKAQLEAASHLKTIELQRAIAASDKGPRIGMAATVIALLKGPYGPDHNTIQIGKEQRGQMDLGRYGTPAMHTLADVLKDYEGSVLSIARDESGRPQIAILDEREAAFFERLIADDNLQTIFTCAVACEIGSFHGYTPKYGDSPLAVAIAQASGAELKGKWRLTGAYLKPFKRHQLDGVATACLRDSWEGDLEDMPQKKVEAAAWIESHLFRDPEWLAPEMHFGPAHEIAGRVGSMLGVDLPEAKEPEPQQEDDEEEEFDPETEDAA